MERARSRRVKKRLADPAGSNKTHDVKKTESRDPVFDVYKMQINIMIGVPIYNLGIRRSQ